MPVIQQPSWQTYVDILRWRALHQPEKHAYTFLVDGEVEEICLTYKELDYKARAIAAWLQSLTKPGERALLLYPPGLDYIAAFMGCCYAGVVAVPVYPPSSQRSVLRIQTVTADADARLALTTSSVLTKMRAWSRKIPELSGFDWLATDEKGVSLLPEQWKEYAPMPESLAFLQYTSGSTGVPRGVMVSQRNLMHNSEMLRIHHQHTSASVGVSWLPMFHDMGLIGGVLQPLYAGFPAVLLSPTAFIQRPLRWLQAISRYRGTISYAPNFAYELCLGHITPEERSQLDLRSWQTAINAAEPVRAETIERFTAVFAACGLQKTTMAPGYGLAETTLMVSCSAVDAEATIIQLDTSRLEQNRVLVTTTREPGKAQTIVGCGYVAKDQQVVIVNPETMRLCAHDEIGEIWVTGPSITQGYWQRPQETEETFHAYLNATNGFVAGTSFSQVKQTEVQGPFVRTGDLGFVFNREVFITGRLKDLIILRGRNYYPQDIELTVERSHPSLRPGCGAAFSVEIGSEERLVIVQEVMRHYEEPATIIQAVRQALAEYYEIRAFAVVLLRYGSILKTSSGKIQRRACREAFLKKELLVIAADILEEALHIEDQIDPQRQQALWRQLQEATSAEQRAILLSLVMEQVRVLFCVPQEQPITGEQNLLALGMDSLLGTQLVNRLEHLLGRPLLNILPSVMSEPTINRLVAYLTTTLSSAETLTPLPEPVRKDLLGEVAALTEDEAEARLGEQLEALEGKPRENGAIRILEMAKSQEPPELARRKSMQFSLLYFASHEARFSANKYELLLEGARFADQHDFTAVWIPERHFHPFGGLYPNPSTLAAALAMVTHKIRLRAGSVVLPLHHPLRVAEEWSVVDNLSAGRVDLSFALGWNPNDFVLAPTHYEKRKDMMFSGIETFQRLWRGETLTLPNGLDKEARVRIYPSPLQSELTPWITCTGTPERFVEAGTLGANVLTGLLFQSREELAEKIRAYRVARALHGYDPMAGQVTLMLHTFVGTEMEEVRQKVRQPFIEYLRSSVDLWRNEWEKLDALSPQEQERTLAYAFERYFQTHGLFGTPQTCQTMIGHLSEIGVDEIACLIDFGVDADSVMDGLYSLSVLQKRCQRNSLVK